MDHIYNCIRIIDKYMHLLANCIKNKWLNGPEITEEIVTHINI